MKAVRTRVCQYKSTIMLTPIPGDQHEVCFSKVRLLKMWGEFVGTLPIRCTGGPQQPPLEYPRLDHPYIRSRAMAQPGGRHVEQQVHGGLQQPSPGQ